MDDLQITIMTSILPKNPNLDATQHLIIELPLVHIHGSSDVGLGTTGVILIDQCRLRVDFSATESALDSLALQVGELRAAIASDASSTRIVGTPSSKARLLPRSYAHLENHTLVLESKIVDVSALFKPFGSAPYSNVKIADATFHVAPDAIVVLDGFFQDPIFRPIQLDDRLKLTQRLVWKIAKASTTTDYGDPIFLTRPSNLWRLRVKPFQNEDGWKTMIHLRHCFNALSSEALSENEPGATCDLRTETLEALLKWRSWDIGDLASCAVFTKLFAATPDGGNPNAKTLTALSQVGVEWNLGNISVRMFDSYQEPIATSISNISLKGFVTPSRNEEASNAETQTQKAAWLCGHVLVVDDWTTQIECSFILTAARRYARYLQHFGTADGQDKATFALSKNAFKIICAAALCGNVRQSPGETVNFCGSEHFGTVSIRSRLPDKSVAAIALNQLSHSWMQTSDSCESLECQMIDCDGVALELSQNNRSVVSVIMEGITAFAHGSESIQVVSIIEQVLVGSETQSSALPVFFDTWQEENAALMQLFSSPTAKQQPVSSLCEGLDLRVLSLEISIEFFEPLISKYFGSANISFSAGRWYLKTGAQKIAMASNPNNREEDPPIDAIFGIAPITIVSEVDEIRSEIKTVVHFGAESYCLNADSIPLLGSLAEIYTRGIMALQQIQHQSAEMAQKLEKTHRIRFFVDQIGLALQNQTHVFAIKLVDAHGRLCFPDEQADNGIFIKLDRITTSFYPRDDEQNGTSFDSGISVTRVGHSIVDTTFAVDMTPTFVILKPALVAQLMSFTQDVMSALHALPSRGQMIERRQSELANEIKRLETARWRIAFKSNRFTLVLPLDDGKTAARKSVFLFGVKSCGVEFAAGTATILVTEWTIQFAENVNTSNLNAVAVSSLLFSQNRLLIPKIDGRVDFISNATSIVMQCDPFDGSVDVELPQHIQTLFQSISTASPSKTQPRKHKGDFVFPTVEIQIKSGSIKLHRPIEKRSDFRPKHSASRSAHISSGLQPFDPKALNQNSGANRIDGLSDTFIQCPSLSIIVSASSENMHVDLKFGPLQNTLSPSILSFVGAFSNSLYFPSRPPTSAPKNESSTNAMTVLIHLPQARIDFNCLPFARVEFNTTLIATSILLTFGQEMNVLASVASFSGRLRHEYAPEDCITVQVDELHLSSVSERETSVIALSCSNIGLVHTVRHLHDLILFYKAWCLPPTSTRPRSTQSARSKALKTSSNIHACISLPKIKVSVDLSQAIGKTEVLLQDLRLDHNVIIADIAAPIQTSISALKLLEVKASGRLSGLLFGLVNVKLMSCRNPSKSPSQQSAITLQIERILGMTEFNFERIYVLDLEPLQFRATNMLDASGKVSANFDVIAKKMQGVISKTSAPCLIEIFRKLSAIVDEKVLLAQQDFVKAGTSEVILEGSMPLEFSDAFKTFMTDASITVRFVDFKIALFKEHIDVGQDCVKIKLDAFATDLVRHFDPSRMHQELTLALSGHTTVSKCLKNEKIAKDSASHWSISQWADHVSSRTHKLILDLPPTELYMETFAATPEQIDYIFTTNFGGPIDVNLNLGFYRFFQDIIVDFMKEINHDRSGASSNALSPVTTTFSTVSSSSTVAKVFKALGPIKLDPQLKAIDGATPPDVLKWLGIKKETIPPSVYSGLTNVLDGLLMKALGVFLKR
jgi:hypothetical protein